MRLGGSECCWPRNAFSCCLFSFWTLSKDDSRADVVGRVRLVLPQERLELLVRFLRHCHQTTHAAGADAIGRVPPLLLPQERLALLRCAAGVRRPKVRRPGRQPRAIVHARRAPQQPLHLIANRRRQSDWEDARIVRPRCSYPDTAASCMLGLRPSRRSDWSGPEQNMC